MCKFSLANTLSKYFINLGSHQIRYESLSPGEIQRVYFIRLFVHRPLIALLDEATSALPLQMEDVVYRECQRLGITLISVGHRDSLRQYHDYILSLGNDGGWDFRTIDHVT